MTKHSTTKKPRNTKKSNVKPKTSQKATAPRKTSKKATSGRKSANKPTSGKKSSATKKSASVRSAPVVVNPVVKAKKQITETAKRATTQIKQATRELDAKRRATLKAQRDLERAQAQIKRQAEREAKQNEREAKRQQREEQRSERQRQRDFEKAERVAVKQEPLQMPSLDIATLEPSPGLHRFQPPNADEAATGADERLREAIEADEPPMMVASAVRKQKVTFLTNPYPYIYDGEFNLVGGAPGAQKTIWVTSMVARATRLVNAFGDALIKRVNSVPKRYQGKVLMYSAEDVAFITTQRLEDLGADMNKVKFINYWKNPEDGSRVEITLDKFDYLDREWARERPRLAVFDMFDSFTGGVSLQAEGPMKVMCSNLRLLARKHHVTIVALLHCNKYLTSISDIFKGSNVLKGHVRSAVFIMEDPYDTNSENKRRILFHAKSSYVPTAPSRAFVVANDENGKMTLKYQPEYNGMWNLENVIHAGTLAITTRDRRSANPKNNGNDEEDDDAK